MNWSQCTSAQTKTEIDAISRIFFESSVNCRTHHGGANSHCSRLTADGARLGQFDSGGARLACNSHKIPFRFELAADRNDTGIYP